MKRIAIFLPLFLTVPVIAQDEKAGEFAFPADLGGKRVEALLKPGKGGDMTAKAAPLPHRVARSLEDPDPSRPLHLLPPRLALPRDGMLRPPHPAEPMPFAYYSSVPALPQALALPTGELTYWPSVRVEIVPPLPLLGEPKADRASLKDPTVEMSIAAASKRFALSRDGQSPFVAVDIPNPFELKQTVELHLPPPEATTPPLITFPRFPGR